MTSPNPDECPNLRDRQDHDAAWLKRHPARNRTYALYLSVKEKAEAIAVPHLVIDTGAMPLEECLQHCLVYLQDQASNTTTNG